MIEVLEIVVDGEMLQHGSPEGSRIGRGHAQLFLTNFRTDGGTDEAMQDRMRKSGEVNHQSSPPTAYRTGSSLLYLLRTDYNNQTSWKDNA